MIEYWIPAVSTTGLLGLALWMSKSLLITRLTKSVQHDYDKKIEALKSDLKTKETQIDSLRSGALSGVVNKQKVLYERKVQAVEAMWNNVMVLAPAKQASLLLTSIKYEAAIKMSSEDTKVQEFFKMIGKGGDLEYWKNNSAITSRPFISDLAWALFKAYSAILSTAVMQLETLKIGVDTDFTKVDSVLNVVKVALPEYKSYIEEHGINGMYHLLEILEAKILQELKTILEDKKADQESIRRAKEIIIATEALST